MGNTAGSRAVKNNYLVHTKNYENLNNEQKRHIDLLIERGAMTYEGFLEILKKCTDEKCRREADNIWARESAKTGEIQHQLVSEGKLNFKHFDDLMGSGIGSAEMIKGYYPDPYPREPFSLGEGNIDYPLSAGQAAQLARQQHDKKLKLSPEAVQMWNAIGNISPGDMATAGNGSIPWAIGHNPRFPTRGNKPVGNKLNTSANGVNRNSLRTHKPIDKLLKDANTPYNETGLSQAARSWEKHAGRTGGSFPPLKGTIKEKI